MREPLATAMAKLCMVGDPRVVSPDPKYDHLEAVRLTRAEARAVLAALERAGT